MKERIPSNVHAVDPQNPLLPEDFPTPPADTAEVIALLVEDAPRAQGWSVRVAVELAGRWGADTKVLLVDGDLSGAALHEAVGAGNEEGVADLILYGASRERVQREVRDGNHFFVPAGTAVADPENVYRDPRWSAVFSEARESGTLMLLYLPAQTDGVPELAATADRVIRMTSGPPTDELDPDVVVIHSLPGEDPTSQAAPAAQKEAPSPAGPIDVLVGPKPPPSKRRVAPTLLLILLIIIAVALALAGFGYITIPGLPEGFPSFSIQPGFPAEPAASWSTRG